MRKIITLLFLLATQISLAKNAPDSIFQGGNCGISQSDLRTGNIGIGDIPCIIIGIAEILLSFVGYISLSVILLGSLMYIFGGINQNYKETGKTAIKLALIGAIISWSSWLIVNFVIDNL